MSKSALLAENKMLKEMSADLKVKMVLLKQNTFQPAQVVTKYYCEHKDGITSTPLQISRSEKHQQRLEEKLKTMHKVIKNFRVMMAELVDRDGWARSIQDQPDLVGCMYCDAPPITWERLVSLGGRFPHVDIEKKWTCPWRMMEKRAMREYERVN